MGGIAYGRLSTLPGHESALASHDKWYACPKETLRNNLASLVLPLASGLTVQN